MRSRQVIKYHTSYSYVLLKSNKIVERSNQLWYHSYHLFVFHIDPATGNENNENKHRQLPVRRFKIVAFHGRSTKTTGL